MFVWEMLAHRLRADGWHVSHDLQNGQVEPSYNVHLTRADQTVSASGPTLTEAYGAASKLVRNRTHKAVAQPWIGPHFRAGGLSLARA